MKDELSKEYLIEQYKSGKEVREIAKENNCGASTISRLNKKIYMLTINKKQQCIEF